MVGDIYKRGLARMVVIKDYSFEHVTVKEWFPGGRQITHVISKPQLKKDLENGIITKL